MKRKIIGFCESLKRFRKVGYISYKYFYGLPSCRLSFDEIIFRDRQAMFDFKDFMKIYNIQLLIDEENHYRHCKGMIFGKEIISTKGEKDIGHDFKNFIISESTFYDLGGKEVKEKAIKHFGDIPFKYELFLIQGFCKLNY